MTFGERLYQLRTARGWSMLDVGRISNTSKGYIHAMEHGKHSPTLDCLERLAKAFSLSVGELVNDPVPHCSEQECLLISALRDGDKLKAIEILMDCNRI